MPHNWRTVTEYVPDRSWLVEWAIEDRSMPDQPIITFHVAWRSPLTRWWFLRTASGDVTRHQRLREARQRALGGNGRRDGEHSEVTRVVNVPAYGATLHRLAVTGHSRRVGRTLTAR